MTEINERGTVMKKYFIDRTSEFDPADSGNTHVFAGLSYLWILFVLPLIACPQSRFAKFHANQGLVLFIIEAVINLIFGVVIKFVKIVPILGGVAAGILGLIQGIIGIVVLVLAIYCLVRAFDGKADEISVIGSIRIIK